MGNNSVAGNPSPQAYITHKPNQAGVYVGSQNGGTLGIEFVSWKNAQRSSALQLLAEMGRNGQFTAKAQWWGFLNGRLKFEQQKDANGNTVLVKKAKVVVPFGYGGVLYTNKNLSEVTNTKLFQPAVATYDAKGNLISLEPTNEKPVTSKEVKQFGGLALVAGGGLLVQDPNNADNNIMIGLGATLPLNGKSGTAVDGFIQGNVDLGNGLSFNAGVSANIANGKKGVKGQIGATQGFTVGGPDKGQGVEPPKP
jgi:hypothetical protein